MKVTAVITQDELWSLVSTYLASNPATKGIAKTPLVTGPDGSITITVYDSSPGVTTVPILPIGTLPIATTITLASGALPILPGHEVTVDPPYSVTGKATMFGLNWDGSTDAADNGVGFFNDPSTSKPYNTRDKALMGASIPREVILSTFLNNDDWKIGGMIDAVWAKSAATVRDYVVNMKPLLTIDSCGKTARDIPLVDAGPSASTGNALDLTYAVAHGLNTNGVATATYMILVAGKPIEIRGWPIK